MSNTSNEQSAESFFGNVISTYTRAQAIEDALYDLKAVNPHTQPVEDTRTPEELIAIIEAKGREVAKALALLRQ